MKRSLKAQRLVKGRFRSLEGILIEDLDHLSSPGDRILQVQVCMTNWISCWDVTGMALFASGLNAAGISTSLRRKGLDIVASVSTLCQCCLAAREDVL